MSTFDDTTYMERQLSSLFSAEAQDAHLPQGTWQAILPKMGEPDALNVLWRLRNAFSFPRWRNPMNVRYVAPTATVAVALLIALLFILLINDDVDSNEAPVPAGSPTAETGTLEPRPTFTPLPATATPIPTPAPQPTVDVTSVATDTAMVATEIVSVLQSALEEQFGVGMQVVGEPDCRLRGDVCSLSAEFVLDANPANSYLDEPIEQMRLVVADLSGRVGEIQNSTHGPDPTSIQDGPLYRFRVFTGPEPEDLMVISGYKVSGSITLSDGMLDMSLEIET